MKWHDCPLCGDPTDAAKFCDVCRELVFLCGHPKTAENSQKHTGNGHTYPRCRTCRHESYKRWRSA